jgi:asparagine N-glycosylation enzyme membrane subunit Stt3
MEEAMKWATCVSRAVLMGLAWAAAWVPVGVLAGALIAAEVEPEYIGGPLYAGFLCGAFFSVVAGIASGRRRLEELSLGRAGASGVVIVPLLAVLPFVLGDTSGEPFPWLLYIAVVGGVTLLSAASAVVSALFARSAKNDPSVQAA